MRVVNLALDVIFKTLDTIDAVRDKIDEVMGANPKPDSWTVKWPAENPQARNQPQQPQETLSTPITPTKKKATKKKAANKKKATKKKAKKKR